MNKQEKEKFIEKILSWGSWCNEVHTGELDRYVKISKVRELIKCVNEPQKVKVPAFVAELLDYYRNSTDVDLLALLICFKDWYFRKDKLSENEEAIDWLVRHPEKFMKAWLDGYEVEEEPKYRVNIGGLYLKEPLADTNDFTISMTWNKDYAYPFDSWNMAREHTSELGGTVEKV